MSVFAFGFAATVFVLSLRSRTNTMHRSPMDRPPSTRRIRPQSLTRFLFLTRFLSLSQPRTLGSILGLRERIKIGR